MLSVIEVKHNAADLVYARLQRERFVQLVKTAGPSIKFSNREAEDFGRHAVMSHDRFGLFLSEPHKRWLFSTVRDKSHLSLPFYSKISHWFVRTLASIASHHAPPLPPPPLATTNAAVGGRVNATPSSSTATTSPSDPLGGGGTAAAGSRRGRSSNGGGGATAAATAAGSSEWLRDWVESVRSRYSAWNPTDDECRKLTESLSKAWTKCVRDSGVDATTGENLLQPPSVILHEDDEVRAAGGPGIVAWLDLPPSPSSPAAFGKKT